MGPGASGKCGFRLLTGALVVLGSATASFACIAAILAYMRGHELLDHENVGLSLVCTIIAWSFAVMFHLVKETVQLPVTQAGMFLANARRVLRELGYEIGHHTATSLTTRHAFRFLIFRRGIQISCGERQASITGPKLWVDVLRRRLRVQNFLVGSQTSAHDPQRLSDLLLKRVQIRMRVQPDNLEEIARYVLDLLTQEADVVCEINLLANSAAGIHESMVENQIRPWLAEQEVSAEIHKDLVKMTEPNATIIQPGNLRRRLAMRS